MVLSESIFIALFCIVMVFIVLIILWGVIRLFSFVILEIEKNLPDTLRKNKQ